MKRQSDNLTAREIFLACKGGNAEAINLLKNKIQINPEILLDQKNGLARIVKDLSEYNNIELLDFLIDNYNSYFTKAKGEVDSLILDSVIEQGNEMMSYRLIETFPALLNQKSGNNSTILHFAAQKGSVEFYNFLVNSVSQEILASRDLMGNTALHYTILANVEKTKLLLAKSPEMQNTANNTGELPFDLIGDEATKIYREFISDKVDAPLSPPIAGGAGGAAEASEPIEDYVPNEDEIKLVTDSCKKIVREICENNVEMFKGNGEIFIPMVSNNTGIDLAKVLSIIENLGDESMQPVIEPEFVATDEQVRLVANACKEFFDANNVQPNIYDESDMNTIVNMTGVSFEEAFDIIDNGFM